MKKTGVKKTHSIKSLLAVYNFIPLFFTVCVFSTAFYVFTSQLMLEREKRALTISANQITSSIEAELTKMSTLAFNISYSYQLKSNIQEHLELFTPESQASNQEKFENTKKITTVIREITGPYKQVPQVTLILPELHLIGYGLYAYIHPVNPHTRYALSNYNWKSGAMLFSGMHTNTLSESMDPTLKHARYISLYKTVFDHYQNPLAVLEIEQFADTIFSKSTEDSQKLIVFDRNGIEIYPNTTPQGSIYQSFLTREAIGTVKEFFNPATKKSEMIATTESISSGWLILTVTDGQKYLLPIYRFLGIMIVISLIILGSGFLLSSFLSRRIARSLAHLNTKINQLDWSRLASAEQGNALEKAKTHSSVNEVNALHLSFQAMNDKLDESFTTLLAEKTLQTQSRMLALQGQMDPHFIYNMLTNISIMAENKDNKEIIDTINHFTRILRYISNGANLIVTIEEELQIVDHYIACMHVRFGEALSFTKDIPPQLLSVQVPRHSILPIVENSIKYGMKGAPPWEIRINGAVTEKGWQISVSDSGPGFEEAALKKIQADLETCKTNKKKQLDSHINGMGLLNLYSRLLIFYQDALFFTLENTYAADDARDYNSEGTEPGTDPGNAAAQDTIPENRIRSNTPSGTRITIGGAFEAKNSFQFYDR